MKNSLHTLGTFIKYNNTLPLVLSTLLLGAGATFASTDVGQQAIAQAVVGQKETVVSIDNTYIANKDLSVWSPKVVVTAVTETDTSYFVTYTLSTIDLDQNVWKDVQKSESMTVDKKVLADYKSLEDYVQFQLKQVIDAESDRLARTQQIEKQHISQLAVKTVYTGLVGLALDEKTEVKDPYAPAPESLTPGVPTPPTPVVTQTASVVASSPEALPSTPVVPEVATSTQVSEPASQSETVVATTTPPVEAPSASSTPDQSVAPTSTSPVVAPTPPAPVAPSPTPITTSTDIPAQATAPVSDPTPSAPADSTTSTQSSQ